jgi:RNase adapter protein RapZ
VFDVRFLQNPFFVEELRDKSGLDPAVSAYVLEQPGATEFLERAEGLCRFLLPNYREEGKSYLTVSIGCTGGRHRSVVIAHELSRRLGSAGERVRVWDRDVELA